MRIQIISDLHLDFSGVDIPTTDADCVVIAGDTASRSMHTLDFLERFDKPVVLIAGNHEFDFVTIDEFNDYITHEIAEHPSLSHVHYLHNSSVTLGDVHFHGCPLWTNFMGCPQLFPSQHDNIINSSMIFQGTGVTPVDAIGEFNKSISFLEKAIIPGEKNVVVTHFLPHIESVHPRFIKHPCTPYFMTGPHTIFDLEPNLWIHGHTHDTMDYTVDKTQVVCNPRGYSRVYNLSENTRWNPTKVVEV